MDVEKILTDPYQAYGATRGWTGAGRPTPVESAFYSKLLGHDVGYGKRLLDLGYGDGRLLTWVKSRGGEAVGLERQTELVDGARKAGFQVEYSIDQFAASSIDVITAFDVLEHIENNLLLPLVQSLVARLRPGGRLIARVPNCQIPAGIAIQYSDHTHCTALSEPIVRWLFEHSGLDSITVTGAPEMIGSGANIRERLKFVFLPLRMVARSFALRLIGVPKDVSPAHNLIVTGTKAQENS